METIVELASRGWGLADTMTSGSGLRAYLRRLRTGLGVTQEELSEAMGMSRRAVIDWEAGETKSLKNGPLIRAVRFLGASLADIEDLIEREASDEEGRIRADAWLPRAKSARMNRNHIADMDMDTVIDAMGADAARQLADRLMRDPEFFEDFIRGVVERGKQKP